MLFQLTPSPPGPPKKSFLCDFSCYESCLYIFLALCDFFDTLVDAASIYTPKGFCLGPASAIKRPAAFFLTTPPPPHIPSTWRPQPSTTPRLSSLRTRRPSRSSRRLPKRSIAILVSGLALGLYTIWSLMLRTTPQVRPLIDAR